MPTWREKLQQGLTEDQFKEVEELARSGYITEDNIHTFLRRLSSEPPGEDAIKRSLESNFGANVRREWRDIRSAFADPTQAIDLFKEEVEQTGWGKTLGNIAVSTITSTPKALWTIGTGGLGESENPIETMVAAFGVVPAIRAGAGITSLAARGVARGAMRAGKTARVAKWTSKADAAGKLTQGRVWKPLSQAAEVGDVVAGMPEWVHELIGQGMMEGAGRLGGIGLKRLQSHENVLESVVGMANSIQTNEPIEEKIRKATTLVSEDIVRQVMEENELESTDDARNLILLNSLVHYAETQAGQIDENEQAKSEAQDYDNLTGAKTRPARPWSDLRHEADEERAAAERAVQSSSDRLAETEAETLAETQTDLDADTQRATQAFTEAQQSPERARQEQYAQHAQENPEEFNNFRNQYLPLYHHLAPDIETGIQMMEADFANNVDPTEALAEGLMQLETEGIDLNTESPASARTRVNRQLQELLGDELYQKYYPRSVDDIIREADQVTTDIIEERKETKQQQEQAEQEAEQQRQAEQEAQEQQEAEKQDKKVTKEKLDEGFEASDQAAEQRQRQQADQVSNEPPIETRMSDDELAALMDKYTERLAEVLADESKSANDLTPIGAEWADELAAGGITNKQEVNHLRAQLVERAEKLVDDRKKEVESGKPTPPTDEQMAALIEMHAQQYANETKNLKTGAEFSQASQTLFNRLQEQFEPLGIDDFDELQEIKKQVSSRATDINFPPKQEPDGVTDEIVERYAERAADVLGTETHLFGDGMPLGQQFAEELRESGITDDADISKLRGDVINRANQIVQEGQPEEQEQTAEQKALSKIERMRANRTGQTEPTKAATQEATSEEKALSKIERMRQRRESSDDTLSDITAEQQALRDEYIELTIADEIEALEARNDLDSFQKEVLKALQDPNVDPELRNEYIELTIADEIEALEAKEDLDDFQSEVLASLKNAVAPTGETTPSETLENSVLQILRDGGTIEDNAAFFAIADEAYGGRNNYSPKEAYDVLDVAANKYIEEQGLFNLDVSIEDAKQNITAILLIEQRLPTQNVQDRQQRQNQQYNTPYSYAYTVNWVSALTSNDIVFEPSAGTGNLALVAKANGATVHVNEISERRVAMLRQAGFENVTQEDSSAKDLRNYNSLRNLNPTIVIMNPPFSQTGGVKNLNLAGNMIESAFDAMQPGGRLVAIVGGGLRNTETAIGMSYKAAGYKKFFSRITQKGILRADVPVNGRIYTKFGTSFNTRILVLDKPMSTEGLKSIYDKTYQGDLPISPDENTNSMSEVIDLLGGIRDAHAERSGSTVSQTTDQTTTEQQAQGESESERTPEGSGTDTEPESTPRGATDVLDATGTTQRRTAEGSADTTSPDTTETGDDLSPGGTQPTEPSIQNDGTDRGLLPDDKRPEDRGDGDVATTTERTGQLGQGERGDGTVATTRGSVSETRGDVAAEHTRIPEQHLTPLVESTALASTNSPNVDNVEVNISDATKEIISEAQMKGIKLAIRATERRIQLARSVIEGDERVNRTFEYQGGFMFGDDTGVGKTIQGLGFLLHEINQGNNKHLFISPRKDLYKQLAEDWTTIKGGNGMIFNATTVSAKKAIDKIKGIGFMTYGTLIKTPTEKSDTDRLGQVLEYLVGVRPPLSITSPAFSSESEAAADLPAFEELLRLWRLNRDTNAQTFEDRFGPQMVAIAKNAMEGERQLAKSEKDYKALRERQEKFRALDKTTGAGSVAEFTAAAEKFTGTVVFDESHLMRNSTSVTARMGARIQQLLPNAKVIYMSATPVTRIDEMGYASRLGLWGPGTSFTNHTDFSESMKRGGFATKEIVAKDMKALGLYIRRQLDYSGVVTDNLIHQLSEAQEKVYNAAPRLWGMIRNAMDTYMAHIIEMAKEAGEGAPKSAFALKRQLMQNYWSRNQDFYNAMLDTMKMASVFPHMKERLDAGEKVVVQVVNTYEQSQNRQLARAAEENIPLDLIKFTPLEMLYEYVENSFPIHERTTEFNSNTGEYEVVIRQQVKRDNNGNPIRDRDGNEVLEPVIDQHALETRNKMLEQLKEVNLPGYALDLFHQQMKDWGYQTAELSGRKAYYVRDKDGKRGIVKNPDGKQQKDLDRFKDEQIQTLAFSKKAGTGTNMPATTEGIPVNHYVIQSGWNIISMLQGLGRTMRAKRAEDPRYVLATVDLPASMRMSGAIVDKLADIGAAVSGQAKSSMGSRLAARSTEETLDENAKEEDQEKQTYLLSEYGEQALFNLWRKLHSGETITINEDDFAKLQEVERTENVNGTLTIVTELQPQTLEFQQVLNLTRMEAGFDPKTGQIVREHMPEAKQFLNRLMNMETYYQRALGEAFLNELDTIISAAIANDTLDKGADVIDVQSAQIDKSIVINTDEKSGVQTNLVEVGYKENLRRNDWGWIMDVINKRPGYEGIAGEFRGFAQNKRSKVLWAIFTGPTTVDAGGNETRQYQRFNVRGNPSYITSEELTDERYEPITVMGVDALNDLQALAQAEAMWKEQDDTKPFTREDSLTMVTGALLPVWKKISPEVAGDAVLEELKAMGLTLEEFNASLKVKRLALTDGRLLQGRTVPTNYIPLLLQQFGIEAPEFGVQHENKQTFTSTQLFNEQLLDTYNEVTLDNGWILRKRERAGEARISITGDVPDGFDSREGIASEFTTAGGFQYLIQSDDAGMDAFKQLLTEHPARTLTIGSGESRQVIPIEISDLETTTPETPETPDPISVWTYEITPEIKEYLKSVVPERDSSGSPIPVYIIGPEMHAFTDKTGDTYKVTFRSNISASPEFQSISIEHQTTVEDGTPDIDIVKQAINEITEETSEQPTPDPDDEGGQGAPPTTTPTQSQQLDPDENTGRDERIRAIRQIRNDNPGMNLREATEQYEQTQAGGTNRTGGTPQQTQRPTQESQTGETETNEEETTPVDAPESPQEILSYLQGIEFSNKNETSNTLEFDIGEHGHIVANKVGDERGFVTSVRSKNVTITINGKEIVKNYRGKQVKLDEAMREAVANLTLSNIEDVFAETTPAETPQGENTYQGATFTENGDTLSISGDDIPESFWTYYHSGGRGRNSAHKKAMKEGGWNYTWRGSGKNRTYTFSISKVNLAKWKAAHPDDGSAPTEYEETGTPEQMELIGRMRESELTYVRPEFNPIGETINEGHYEVVDDITASPRRAWRSGDRAYGSAKAYEVIIGGNDLATAIRQRVEWREVNANEDNYRSEETGRAAVQAALQKIDASEIKIKEPEPEIDEAQVTREKAEREARQNEIRQAIVAELKVGEFTKDGGTYKISTPELGAIEVRVMRSTVSSPFTNEPDRHGATISVTSQSDPKAFDYFYVSMPQAIDTQYQAEFTDDILPDIRNTANWTRQGRKQLYEYKDGGTADIKKNQYSSRDVYTVRFSGLPEGGNSRVDVQKGSVDEMLAAALPQLTARDFNYRELDNIIQALEGGEVDVTNHLDALGIDPTDWDIWTPEERNNYLEQTYERLTEREINEEDFEMSDAQKNAINILRQDADDLTDYEIAYDYKKAVGEQPAQPERKSRLRNLFNNIYRKKETVNLLGEKIDSADKAAVLGQAYRDPEIETTRLFYVKHGRIIGHEGITLNKSNSTAAPNVDNITKKMNRLKADGFVVLHNHPSGVARFSRADSKSNTTLTTKFGKKFLGSIVVDSGTYAKYWRGESGLMETQNEVTLPAEMVGWDTSSELIGARRVADPLYRQTDSPEQRAFAGYPINDARNDYYKNIDSTQKFGLLNKASDEAILALGQILKVPENWITFAIAGNDNSLSAIVEYKDLQNKSPEELISFIQSEVRKWGGTTVHIYVGEGDWYKSTSDVRNVFTNEILDTHGISSLTIAGNNYTSKGGLQHPGKFIERESKYEVVESNFPSIQAGQALNLPEYDELTDVTADMPESDAIHIMPNPDDFSREQRDNTGFQKALNTISDPERGIRQIMGVKTRQASRITRKTFSGGFGVLEEMSKVNRDGEDMVGDHIRKNILHRQFIGKSQFARDAKRMLPIMQKLEKYVTKKAMPKRRDKLSPQNYGIRTDIRQEVNDKVWRFIEENKDIVDGELKEVAVELKEVWRQLLIEGTRNMMELTADLKELFNEEIYITDSDGNRVPWYPESFDGFEWDAETGDFKRNEGTKANPNWVHYSIEEAHKKANKLYTPHYFKTDNMRSEHLKLKRMIESMNKLMKSDNPAEQTKNLNRIGIVELEGGIVGFEFEPDGTVIENISEMLEHAFDFYTRKELSLRGLLEYTDAGLRAERYGQVAPAGSFDGEARIGYYGQLERARETDHKFYQRDIRLLLETRRLMWDRIGEFSTVGQVHPIKGTSPRLEDIITQVRAFRKNKREFALGAVAVALKAGDPTSMFERLPQFGESVEQGLQIQQDWRVYVKDDKGKRRKTEEYQELDIARMNLTDDVLDTLRTIGFIKKNDAGVDVVAGETARDRRLTVARFFHEFYNTIAQREASVKDLYLSLGHWHTKDPLTFDEAKFWQKVSDLTTISTLSWSTAIQNLLEVPLLTELTGTRSMIQGLAKMFGKEDRKNLQDLSLGLSHVTRFMAETSLAEDYLGSWYSGFSKTDKTSRAIGLAAGLINAKRQIREYVNGDEKTKQRLRRVFDEIQIDTKILDTFSQGELDNVIDEAEKLIMSGNVTPKYGGTGTKAERLAWTTLKSMHYISDATFKAYDATSMPAFLNKQTPIVRLFMKYKSWMFQHNSFKLKNWKRAIREARMGNFRPFWNLAQSAVWTGATYGMMLSFYSMLRGYDEPPDMLEALHAGQTLGMSSVLLEMAGRADGNWWRLSKDMLGQAAGPTGSITTQVIAPTLTTDFDVAGKQVVRRIPVVNLFDRVGGIRFLENYGDDDTNTPVNRGSTTPEL